MNDVAVLAPSEPDAKHSRSMRCALDRRLITIHDVAELTFISVTTADGTRSIEACMRPAELLQLRDALSDRLAVL